MASGRLKFLEIENIDPISDFPGYFVVWSYNKLLRVLSHRLWLAEAILAHKIKIQDSGCHEASRNTYISSFITNQDGVKFSNQQSHRF